jgi:hypothetical protein
MKKFGIFAVAVVAVCALTYVFSGVNAAEPVKSGPQTGEKVPGPFHPLNVNGEFAGEKHCLFCENGPNPVAMIFARENTGELAKLIKKIDESTVANSSAKMGSFVVFLSDSKTLEPELKSLATKEKLAKCVLSIDNVAGPKGYNVAADADVTVVLYKERMVKANFSFKKGELKDGDIEKIVGDVKLIVK